MVEFITTVLPNLSTSVVAILALVYLINKFSDRMDTKDERYAGLLEKREEAFRKLEADVRDKVMFQLNENTKAFEKVFDHIDGKKI